MQTDMHECRYTREVARYIASTCQASVPPEILDKARLHLLDTLAAIICGTRLRAGQQAVSYASSYGGPSQAAIPGTMLVTDAVNAAFTCGMSAHADETDDSHLGGRFHPGCAVVPAALATAQLFTRDGRSLLGSIITGYEIGARSTMSLGYSTPRSGTHSSHCLGANFGAAAAAGALAGLDAIQCEHLLSYATQQASGIAYWERDTDHIEKAFDFGGMGARNGVFGALFVKSGASGVSGSMTGEYSYLSAFGENPDPDRLVRALGQNFEIMSTSIKKWSVGSPIQAALDSVAAIQATEQIRSEDIRHVRVTLPDDRFRIVNNRDMPSVCVQHMIALALVDGRVTFHSSHDGERMGDPSILDMRQRIDAIPSRELTQAKPARQAIVSIELVGGRSLVNHTRAVLGTPDNPMNQEQVEAKALDLMAPVLGVSNARSLIDSVRNIETCPDLNELRPLWQPAIRTQGM